MRGRAAKSTDSLVLERHEKAIVSSCSRAQPSQVPVFVTDIARQVRALRSILTALPGPQSTSEQQRADIRALHTLNEVRSSPHYCRALSGTARCAARATSHNASWR